MASSELQEAPQAVKRRAAFPSFKMRKACEKAFLVPDCVSFSGHVSQWSQPFCSAHDAPFDLIIHGVRRKVHAWTANAIVFRRCFA